jgi:GDP-L-fucose synthase
MDRNASIYVAEDGDMIGNRFVELLRDRGYSNLINDERPAPHPTDLSNLDNYFKTLRPEYVFVTAGMSGGIQTNQNIPADLMLDNLQVACNLIQTSYKYRVRKLLYIASSCTYPKFAEQPMRPEMLMTGILEPTNSAYATAKLAGIELVRAYCAQYSVNYISIIPANIFGPGDDFDQDTSHVIAAILSKIHRARENSVSRVEIWGSGTPTREFIYVDDFIDACVFLMERYDDVTPINVGSGQVKSIAEVGEKI